MRLGPHATLLPHVVLYPGVQVGSHFFAHAHAVVRENCILGDHVTLENGVIIGGDGFGFSKNDQGHWEKIPQSGPVRIGSRVDVQANATIDRATVGATEIGDGTKVDNLVQVGHGSRIGNDSLICAQTGLAGSSVIGNNVILAGQVGIAGHCTVGDGVILTAQSAVSHDVPPGKMISGSPGFDNRIWLRAVTIFQRLPELLKRIDRLEKDSPSKPAPEFLRSRLSPAKRRAAQVTARRRSAPRRARRSSLLRTSQPQPPATPTTSTPPSRTAPAPTFSFLKSTIPAPALAQTISPQGRFTTIAFRSAAAARSKSLTPAPAKNRSRSQAPISSSASRANSKLSCCPLARPNSRRNSLRRPDFTSAAQRSISPLKNAKRKKAEPVPALRPSAFLLFLLLSFYSLLATGYSLLLMHHRLEQRRLQ